MKHFKKLSIEVILISVFCSTICFGHEDASPVNEIKENSFSEDFRLIDQNDISHAMSYYSDYRSILLIGFNTQCTSSFNESGFMTRIRELSEKFKAKIFYIDPDVRNDRKEIQQALMNSKINFPALMDETQMISHSYNIKYAGDFALLDSDSLTPYLKGTLFKKQCLEEVAGAMETGYRKEKIKDCLSSEPLKEIPGQCNLNFLPTENINYTQHVAPVIMKNCIKCHMNENFGSFNGYKKVLGWSSMIRQVLRDQRMPPGGMDTFYHGLMSDYNLRDMRYLMEWAESKKERGLGQDPLENINQVKSLSYDFIEKREPNIVLKQKTPHTIPASGIVEYQEVQLAGPLKEDLWVQALRLKINERVVHHANFLLLDKPLNEAEKRTNFDGMAKVSKKDELIDSIKDNLGTAVLIRENIILTSKKTDNSPTVFPRGVALYLPKGKYLAIEFHYSPTGKIEKNSAELDLYLYKKEAVKKLKAQKVLCIRRKQFVIPPHAKNFTVNSRLKIPQTITALSMRPHFHFRGKSIKYIIESPSGIKETLLSVPFYQFKHQPIYFFSKPKVIVGGSHLITEIVYDNSKEFFQNPDETQKVPLGSQTYTDEMHLPRLFYVDGIFEKYH
jgi:hypothetical protein